MTLKLPICPSRMVALKSLYFTSLQNIIILIIRPYVVREFLGWGKIYALVGDYRRDWLWNAGPLKIARGKLHGYIMHLDLAKWSDRSTFFLGRWNNLEMQLLMRDLIKSGDTIVDIGANRGMFALVASSLLSDAGKVICFEPNPNCLKVLDHEIVSNQIKNISIYRVGLGEREEELTLSVPLFNSGEGTFGSSAYSNEITYQVKANIVRGDELLVDERPMLIKIDVEGFECSVIAGLANTIKRHHPVIITEIVPRQLTACGFSLGDLVRQMRHLGYEGHRLCLRKEHRRHTWGLIRFSMEDRDYDAVWIHSASNSDRIAVLNKHMSNS
jgi:FkbM family methyltransferase